MTHPVRRSWLLVPLSKPELIASAHLSRADVIVLDLVELVAEAAKPAAREQVAVAINQVKAGGAAVFVQADPELLYADLQAAVWPGLTGVVVAQLETAAQIKEADQLITQFEGARGVKPNSVELVASLETARGNQDGYAIATASPRITTLTLGRAELVMDLRPEPSGEIHLMQYLNQRLISLANATGKQPVGAWWRAPDRGLLATPQRTFEAAVRGRAIGYQGSLCLLESQVDALNQGFTPTQEEALAAHRLLEAYHEATAQGAATLLAGDRIVDRGAARQAQGLLAWAAACAEVEQRRAGLREGRPLPTPIPPV